MKENVAPDLVRAQLEGVAQGPVGTPENPSNKILTLANLITICRFLDGWVARATQTVSWFGKVSDPIMDRVLLFTGVLGLVITGDLPIWVAIFVVGRDIVLLGGNIYLRKFWKRPVDVIFIGKLATALFMTGFCLLLLDVPQVTGLPLTTWSWLPGFNGQPTSAGIYLVYIAMVFSTITAVTYYKQGFAIKDEVLAQRAAQEQAQAQPQTQAQVQVEGR